MAIAMASSYLFGAIHVLFAAILGLPPEIFWLYFSGCVILMVGLVKVFSGARNRSATDTMVSLGRVFYAISMAVFGTEHFTNTADIANLVPRWIPGHIFWVYLVGVAFICAGLSLVTLVQARLAATLLGSTFLLFVLLMDLPGTLKHPDNRIFWTLSLRELSFSGGAWAFAGAALSSATRKRLPALVTLGRYFLAPTCLFYGVEHFLHPDRAPGVPLEKVVPTWIPARLFWAYLAGVVLLGAGLCLITNKKAREAAIALGVTILLLMVFVYLPILVASPRSLEAVNYFFDTLLFCGTIFLLAEGLKEQTAG